MEYGYYGDQILKSRIRSSRKGPNTKLFRPYCTVILADWIMQIHDIVIDLDVE